MITLAGTLLSVVLQASTSQVAYVSFCEIVQDPERYDQKTVLTSGVILAEQEVAGFLDPSCPATPERDVGTLPLPIQEATQDTAGWKDLRNLLEKDRRAFVVVRGVFDAYRRYEGPLPDDPRLQEILKIGTAGLVI